MGDYDSTARPVRVGPGDSVVVPLPGDGEPHLCIGPVTITMGADGIPFAERFVLPLLNLDKAWYEASRRYGPYNHHPDRCEDWNLESGGDSDLGEPLVAPFAGIVINAADYGGNWGLILRILGRTPEGELVTWMGAHLDEIYVKPGDIVQAGDVVGTIGNNHGMYAAHLHEQICVGEVPAPWTFGGDRRFDFRQPSGFYAVHGVDADLLTRVTRFDGE